MIYSYTKFPVLEKSFSKKVYVYIICYYYIYIFCKYLYCL